MKYALLLALLFAAALPALASKKEDSFTVTAVEGTSARLSGDSKGLKAGDTLYFARSPFKFTVAEVRGQEIILTLPERHGLSPGSVLLRAPDETIRKNMETEAKLKRALED